MTVQDKAVSQNEAGYSADRVTTWPPLLILCVFTFLVYRSAYPFIDGVFGAGPDGLIYFNNIEEYRLHRFPVWGMTLLPSPYYLEYLVTFLVSLVTNDFEKAMFTVGFVFALLAALSMYYFANKFLERQWPAVIGAGIGIWSFYRLVVPKSIYSHLILQNHAIASISVIVASAWFAAAIVDRRRFISLLIFSFVNTLSDPIFSGQFIAPAILGAVLMCAVPHSNIRRALLVAAGVIGVALAAMVMEETVHNFLWPHRIDEYLPFVTVGLDGKTIVLSGVRGLIALFGRADTKLFLVTTTTMLVIAVAAAGVLLRGASDERPATQRRLAMIMVFVLAVICSIVAPTARGAFISAYEWRYLLVPALFVSVGVGVVAGCIILVFVGRVDLNIPFEWGVWTWRTRTMVLGLGFAACFWLGSPAHVGARTSAAAPFQRCVVGIEQHYGLHGALASTANAIMMRAAFASREFRNHAIVVQMNFLPPFSYVLSDANNVALFNEGEIERLGGFDHIVFEDDRDLPAARENVAKLVGSPDEVLRCPNPLGVVGGGGSQVWIYKNSVARKRLGNLVINDDNHGTFYPPYRMGKANIDPVFGMMSVLNEGEVRDGERTWVRSLDKPDGGFAQTKTLLLPSGEYHVAGCVKAEGNIPDRPYALLELSFGGRVQSQHELTSSDGHFDVVLNVGSKGAPTSGRGSTITFFAREANRLSICGLSVERLDRKGLFQPLSIFE